MLGIVIVDLSHIQTYENLEQYLRTFTNPHGDSVPYDFVGVYHLFLALLDNLDEHSLSADLQEIKASLTPRRVDFLKALIAANGGA